MAEQPPDAVTLHWLGVSLLQQGEPAKGLALIRQSIAQDATRASAHADLGHALAAMGGVAEALASYARALQVDPQCVAALNGQGNILASLGKLPEALHSFDEALRCSPDLLPALNNSANVLAMLKRPEQALERYARSLALFPDDPEVMVNRGSAYAQVGRHAEALVDYQRALVLKANFPEAYYHCGLAHSALGQHDAALASFRQAIRLRPGYAEAHAGCGNALVDLGQPGQALQAYERALQLNPELAAARFCKGVVLMGARRFEEAIAAFGTPQPGVPPQDYALGTRLHAQLHLFEWSEYGATLPQLLGAVANGTAGADFPFSFFAVSDDPELQLRCARQFAASFRPTLAAAWSSGRRHHDRLRIAYISADFLEHPTSYLLAGLFERHDRERFEIIGVSLREDTDSLTGRRVRAAFDRCIEVQSRSDDEIAALLRELEVDIAVDLMGYTGQHRTGILARRPAPIQVNYLGFPGTMGVADIDYLIADEYLVPRASQLCYAERIVYMPDCFQANDDRRPLATDLPTRASVGLPEHGFVWCSFHAGYKINPPLFDIWVRLVQAVPGSVLWLVAHTRIAEENLRREARSRGLDEQRLVFARGLPYAQHLARLALADLCLDTFPFNGGATSSDALWAGVPLVSCAGRAFASRMSGSLLRASGLPELATATLAEYERLALALATAPARLAGLRHKLVAGRPTNPLFDTDRFRLHLEAAYSQMWSRHCSGTAPATLTIPGGTDR